MATEPPYQSIGSLNEALSTLAYYGRDKDISRVCHSSNVSPPAFCDLGPCLTSAVFLSVVFSLFGAHGSLLPLWATCYTVGIF